MGKSKVVRYLQAKFSLCSLLGILFQKAGIQNLAALALPRDICGSVFWTPVPRRVSCPGHQGELCKAQPSPFAQPRALSPCKDASQQVPGPDTHRHTRQTQLQPCFTFTSGTNSFPLSCLHHSLATLGKQCRIFCNSTVSKANKHCTSDWTCLQLEQTHSLLCRATAFI